MKERLGLLTGKQLQVLALHARGLSISKIAEELGVSRQDASVALRRAKRNLEKALETIEAYYAAASPVLLRTRPGETLGEAAARLIELADERGIRLPLGRAELAILLRVHLRSQLQGDRILEEACIAIGPGHVPVVVDCSLASALRGSSGEDQ